jgi:ADP-heptose:LPS heptosyltransferase
LTGVRSVLVIKHGALGDMVLATGAFAAIRARHPDDRVTLLTTPPFETWGRDSGLFDALVLDPRSKLPLQVMAATRRIYHGRHDIIYDLQGSERVSLYRLLTWSTRPVRWSRPSAKERRLPPQERHAAQLRRAGVKLVPAPDLAFLDGDIARFGLPPGFALMVPGASSKREEKRWLWRNFVDVGQRLGRPVVLVGTDVDAEPIERIAQMLPGAINLCGRTTLGDLAGLGRQAAVAVGNDTGPMHLFAAVQCPSVVLFTSTGDPTLSAPRGAHVEVCMDARPDDVVKAADRVAP